MIETFEVRKPWWKRGSVRAGGFAVLLLAAAAAALWQQTRPPADFPLNTAIVIPRGLTAADIAALMEAEGLARSELLLYLTLLMRHDPSSIQAGAFVFDRPLSVFALAAHLSAVGGADNLLTLTLPEGYTAREFAALAEAVLPDFDEEDFAAAAAKREGYLFPDTYYVPADFTATELRDLQLRTFNDKTLHIIDDMKNHPLREYGVLTLASILEREANTEESMRMVSGILQNRLEIDMPLQADASLEYALDGRSLRELTAEDIENIDSPYNTYKYRGLPPTPIGNPGLAAIMAVLDPIQSDYFYYLTDNNGAFHYAETFDQHRDNVARYLR